MSGANGHWVYVLGEVGGGRIKIGESKDATMASRLRSINAEQFGDRYVLLAACLGSRKDEVAIREHFEHVRDKSLGSHREYFHADGRLVGYISWLRRQWWTSISEQDSQGDWESVDPSHWMPGPGRHDEPPVSDPGKLVQDFEQLDGPLAGTAWAWMPSPKSSIQDYFTPPEIIAAVGEGMGGIDLDAASHWLANRVHRIPEYFDVNKSAFAHEWFGNVWLNPPYGNNGPWFARALEQIESGNVRQLAILSPVWAFTTALAGPLMEQVAATILLVPTPKFWGNKDPSKTGTNNPHCIVYFGDRRREMFAALQPFGIPFTAAWADASVLADEARA